MAVYERVLDCGVQVEGRAVGGVGDGAQSGGGAGHPIG